jgi:SHAQKYF class myb-like DNA-binding protein
MMYLICLYTLLNQCLAFCHWKHVQWSHFQEARAKCHFFYLVTGEAWTEEEHKKFLFGLNKLGKGDWRGISRNYVISRTPTQVASHAQKYFNRQTNVHRRKRRSSLFDMVIDDVSISLSFWSPLFVYSWVHLVILRNCMHFFTLITSTCCAVKVLVAAACP